MAEKKKGGLKELSPITIYKSLPKTNCKECGQDNCMAFATKIVNREIELDSCKPLFKPENAKSYAILKDLLKPAVKEVIVGVGDKAKKIGGKLVMYRHEFTYKNPTAIAIDVTDEMSDSEIVSRVQKTDNFSFRIHRQHPKTRHDSSPMHFRRRRQIQSSSQKSLRNHQVTNDTYAP